MHRRKGIEICLIVLFLIFSTWLMNKSFGYEAGVFRVARHQVGDFGLHLSLIRSFSWGDNMPVESPFFPGTTLPYHYGFDLVIGVLEKSGMRIDYALNGLSVLFFSALLFGIYSLTGAVLGANILRSLLSVVLLLFSSNLTFVTFLRGKVLDGRLLGQLWTLPDYIYKGPCDGSVISIFSSLNPLLNRRHLIAGLMISTIACIVVLGKVKRPDTMSWQYVFILGSVLGLSTRVHTLVSFSTIGIVAAFLLLFGRVRLIIPFLVAAFSFSLFHIQQIIRGSQLARGFFRPGFLVDTPVQITAWLSYWWQNFGLMPAFLIIGLMLVGRRQRMIFVPFFMLFVLVNLFQLSYRMEHNFSLVFLFSIGANMYVSHALFVLWTKGIPGKVAMTFLLFVLIASGVLNLMVIKNDYQYRVADAPYNNFLAWIKAEVPERAIFLGRQELFDPITLAGRKNYLGATYYSDVMGLDVSHRRELVRNFFESRSLTSLEDIRDAGIDYLAIPNSPRENFPYAVDRDFLDAALSTPYRDADITVYKL